MFWRIPENSRGVRTCPSGMAMTSELALARLPARPGGLAHAHDADRGLGGRGRAGNEKGERGKNDEGVASAGHGQTSLSPGV